MPHNRHHYERVSHRSQEKKYRRIEWMRRAKKWFKKSLIVIIVLLALAVLLSYFLINRESVPDGLELQKKGVFENLT